MAYEADRVVVELLAETQGFDGNVKKSASTFSQSMDQIEGSAAKAERGFTRSSANRTSAIQREASGIARASQLIGTQLDDLGAILAKPTSPFVAPVKQAPAVRNAMGLVQSGATALGGVLGGALVTAGLAAGSMLAELITKHSGLGSEVDNLVEKLKEEAQSTHDAEQAQSIFANTLEGVTQATEANERALKKLNDEGKTAARRALEASLQTIERTKNLQAETRALLQNAEAQLARQQAILTGVSSPQAREFAAQNLNTAQQRIDSLRKTLGDIDNLIQRNEASVAAATSRLVVEVAGRASDPLERIKQKYEGRGGLIEQARQAALEQADVARKAGDVARAQELVTTELTKQVALLAQQQKKEEDAYRASQRRARSTRDANQQSGRQINEAQARQIVASIGGTPTSGFRTEQHNRDVGGVPNSFHTKGQALDIAKTAGMTLDKIVKAFEAQGVKLIEKLDEGDHFHVAWSKRGTGRQGPSDETLARRAQAEADKELRREQAFQNEKANLQADELDARQALVTSAEEIAKYELQAIEISRQKYADNVASLVEQRKLTEGEAAELLKLNDERAKLRAELVQRREDQRKFRMREAEIERANAIQQGGMQAQEELLRSQQEIAKTQRERLDIGQRLVRLQFEEERLALEAAVARADRLRAEYARTKSQQTLAELEQAEVDAAIAKQRLQTIDQRQGSALQGNAQANASPLQSYFGDIQAQADDLNTAFETIAAGGLANFTDRLTDAIVNFRSLGDVGRAVLSGITADLVKLAIRLVLNATIGKLVSKVVTTSTALQGAAVASAWAPAAAAVSLATLGANAGPAAAAIASTNALAMGFAAASGGGAAAGGAFAEGGRIFGPGSSTSDDVPINASVDEFMIKARSARKIGYPVLEHINQTGELPAMLRAPGYAGGGRLRRLFPANDTAASPSSGLGGADMGQLRSIIGEAVTAGIGAMPDVNLFTSLDPADILQRALATAPGQRALIATLGENSQRVKATLR